MTELTMGLIGVIAGCFLLLVGCGLGVSAGRKSGVKWLEEHACYLCQEKYEDEHGHA
jgi:hypothetical protein